MQGLVKRKDIGIEKQSVKMRFSSSKNVLNPSKLPDRNDQLCVCTKEKSFIIIVILCTSSAYINTTCTLPQVLYAAILGTHTHTHTHTRVTAATHRQTLSDSRPQQSRLSDTSEATVGSKRRRGVQGGAERCRAALLVNTAARPAVSQPTAT